MDELTSGTDALDQLIEGVRVGDNLVLQGTEEVPLAAFGERFLDSVSRAGGKVVHVVVGDRSPAATTRHDGGVTVTWPRGDDAMTPEQAFEQLEHLDAEAGRGAAFLFDSLTAVMELWGEDAALDLFLRACPRLYRRESLAMWMVDPSRHRPGFLSRLQQITQVVIDIASTDAGMEAEVAVAQGRPQGVVGRKMPLELGARGIVATGPVTSGRQRLGEVIRAHRTSRGLAQAELARRIGVSPSALSQVERGVRGMSAESLMRIWEALAVPFGPQDTQLQGYRVARRGGPSATRSAPGMRARRFVADATVGELWLVEIEAGASGRGPLFETKAAEVATVLQGVLDLEVGRHVESLQAGDTIVLTRAVPGGWANPSAHVTEVVWSISGGTLHT